MGGSNCNFWEKTFQVHSIIIREWPNSPPSPCILFDPPTIRHIRVDQSRKGDGCLIIANSETAAVLESLQGLFSELTRWIVQKVSETQFPGQNWVPKAPKLPKIHISQADGYKKLVDPSKRTQALIYCECSEIWILLRQPEVPQKWNVVFFLGLIMTKLYNFQYLVNRRSYKLIDPSKWPQGQIYYGCCKICICLRKAKMPKKCILCFYLALYDISKVSILRQLFIIMYQFIIIHMQIGKNQRKISFHIGGTNFCNNLHLAISLCIIQF